MVRRRWLIATAALVAAATGLWAWRGTRRPPIDSSSALDPRRIAVLYFDDLSGDGRLQHIAAGFTQDLIDVLSEVRALRVISPEGVRPFRGSNVLLDSIARTLSVGTIVAGSVAEFRDRLRVSVRMIDPVTGVQLLTQTVERPVTDLFEVQKQITNEVATGLRERLGPVVELRERRAGTRNLAAWELLQRADRVQEDARTVNLRGDVRSALRMYGTADSLLRMSEALDPRWTDARVERGWVAYAIGLVSSSSTPGALERWFRTGIAYADSALALQTDDPEALQLRGMLRYRLWNLSRESAHDSVLNAAERDLQAATSARPNLARAWHVLASLYLQRAEFKEAHAAAQRALEADAYLNEVRSVVATLFFTALHLGQENEARARCEEGLARFPEDPRFMECRLTLLGWFGRGRNAVTEAQRVLAEIERRDSAQMLVETWGYRRMLVAVILARSGLRDSAAAVIARTHAEASATPQPAALLAEANAQLLLGDRARALALIGQYLTVNPAGRRYVAATPWFTPLHDDSSFRAAVALP